MYERQFQNPRHISRRFTTLEGWHEVREGVFALGQKSLIFSLADQFDLERDNSDNISSIALSRARSRESNGEGDPYCEDTSKEDQLNDELRVSSQPEKPYHVYTSSQKWRVVVLVGAAGLFSGLSSNIYFPALDVIAKVRLGLEREEDNKQKLKIVRAYASDHKMSILQSPHNSSSRAYLRCFVVRYLISSVDGRSISTHF